MSNFYTNEQAFKSKAKLLAAFLDLPHNVSLNLWSRILGFRDYDEARRHQLEIPEVPSTKQLVDRISQVIPDVAAGKVRELVALLKLRTVDDLVAEPDGTSAPSSYIDAATGALSASYQTAMQEAQPAFLKIWELSLAIKQWDNPAPSIRSVNDDLSALHVDDARAAIEILTPVHCGFPHLLPVSTAMLQLLLLSKQLRKTRVYQARAHLIFDEMCDMATAANGTIEDKTRSELEHYGLLIAGVMRQLGAHDKCFGVLGRIATLHSYPTTQGDHTEHYVRKRIRREAAISAMFAGDYQGALTQLAPDMLGTESHAWPVTMTVEAICRAQLGEKRLAGELVDFLLCCNKTRSALGLDRERKLPRRQPERLPLAVNKIQVFDKGDWDTLRHVDLRAFGEAMKLFSRHDQRLRSILNTSDLVLKGVQFLDLQYPEKQPKKRKALIGAPIVSPFTLEFGRPCDGPDNETMTVLCLAHTTILQIYMMEAPVQLADVCAGNAHFQSDPAKVRWLKHILSSEEFNELYKKHHFNYKTLSIQLSSGRTLPGLMRPDKFHVSAHRNLPGNEGYFSDADTGLGIDWAISDLCFELFLACEHAIEPSRPKIGVPRELSAVEVAQAVEALREKLEPYLKSTSSA